jgi:hypothetical protein
LRRPFSRFNLNTNPSIGLKALLRFGSIYVFVQGFFNIPNGFIVPTVERRYGILTQT